jgi:hypothetical protein
MFVSLLDLCIMEINSLKFVLHFADRKYSNSSSKMRQVFKINIILSSL